MSRRPVPGLPVGGRIPPGRWRSWIAAGALALSPLVSAGQDAVSCNPWTGLDGPLPTCAEAVCDRPAEGLGVEVVTGATIVPECRTAPGSGRPLFDDSPPWRLRVPPGTDRWACLHVPPGTGPEGRRPLVLFFHGGGAGAADDVYDHTSLRSKADSFVLGDRPGFILVSVQGRNLRYPTSAPRDGRHHDFYFRDLASPSRNPDVALVDAIVDRLVAGGLADPSRIYVTGWSNGGFFAELYGIARHRRSTPGGNRVAAVAVFSAADPFADIRRDDGVECALDPYPRSDVPILVVSRSCDLVACDPEQEGGWNLQTPANPGQIVSTWMDDLAEHVHDHNGEWILITGFGTETETCTPPSLCTFTAAMINHLRWPDGVADGSGIDHEVEMLEFLGAHPLDPPPPRSAAGRSGDHHHRQAP